jgi:hypothetical protein
MLEQVSTSVKFVAFYTASKTGKTGLTVTVDLYDPSGTQIVTDGSATAIGGGLYSYTLSTNNSAEGEYAAIFKTSDSTVDSQHIPSLWVLGRAGVENLDAAVSSRSTLTAAQVNTEADTALSDVGLTSTITGRIDQAISTRLAAADYTAPTSAPTVVAIRQEMDSNSTKLANLDASVSSRLATSGYTAPTSAPTVADIRTELAVELGRLDASVSSRLAGSSYTAPTTPPTAAEITTAVWAAADKTGYSLTSAERTAIAAAVEGSLLNEADGQAVLNAIVGAIGNTNLSEVSLVAAVRADLERNGGKLDSIPTTAAPSASAVASATRTELSTELSRIDQSISSRLASADYTAPTAAPTAAQNASAVRTELSTELARIDAPISGATAPSAATVASAVRTELSTELGRVDAAVSTRLAASAYTAPANSDIAAVKAKTDNLPASPAATGDIPSANITAIKAKTDLLNTDRLANVATTNIVGTLLAQANS